MSRKGSHFCQVSNLSKSTIKVTKQLSYHAVMLILRYI
uniref:Uncharacterized protein n=1 Tax=Arundo donax TaxID=35708 RepID=A0A0A9HQH6_ARUDO